MKYYQIAQQEIYNLSKHHAQPRNCRKKEDCPLVGKCSTENINYKSIVSTSGHPNKTYLGTAEGDFYKKML